MSRLKRRPAAVKREPMLHAPSVEKRSCGKVWNARELAAALTRKRKDSFGAVARTWEGVTCHKLT